ncbi:MAG: PEP/pyruvate-binding domain-containing protein [Sedimentisphaerales bacterium]
MCFRIRFLLLVLTVPCLCLAGGDDPEPAWKNQIEYPSEEFQSWTSPPYVKFTIITKEGFDPNVVCYQDCRKYEYHFDFALECLDPFIGMTIEQFDDVTLHEAGQQAMLGAVILSPRADPPFNEYGIQLVRNDPYSREEIVRLFNIVKASVIAEPNVTAYYFPTYEQYTVAQQNRDWFESQGILIGSTAQWAEGNVSYSDGWALGTLKFFVGSEIQAAFINGDLLPEDILMTDGVPAEIPSVAGIISLMPSTPNSHVAILSKSQGIPFVYLAIEQDAARAQGIVNHSVYLAASSESMELFCTVKLLDIDNLSGQEKASILALKETSPLTITPMKQWGQLWADTNDLQPADIGYVGGKAANFGILRQAIPDNSPKAMAFSFNLWNAFLDQSLPSMAPIVLAPGGYALFWADDDTEQGPFHAGFKLSRSGEDVGLFDSNGQTLIDGLSFGPQQEDISYGRSVDGGDMWQFFENPSPGAANSPTGDSNGLVINEFMADNKTTIEDPAEIGEFPDWIELYNGTSDTVILSGMFLTDDLNDPTKWQIRSPVSGGTIRDEIALRLSQYTRYPPADMKGLSRDLAAIRNLIENSNVTQFDPEIQSAIIEGLETFGFDPDKKIRFRSSTNVEDSEQFTGAGLYDSYSGCLADDLDQDDAGPCACNASEDAERGVFRAIRKVFASFYNDNAFLERLKHGVNEADAGMALLAHHSFPDEIELANGVATMQKSWGTDWTANVVCQKGAVSVTNPPVDAVPEEVRIEMTHFQGAYPWLLQRSSLVPLRENTVLEWEQEYIELYELLAAAAEQYCQVVQKDGLMLDFEFKKVAPEGKLIIKQIREIPLPGNVEYTTPYMLAEPREYWSLQGRGSNVFTSHRLKSRWMLKPKNIWLSEDNLQQCIYDTVDIEYVADGQVKQISAELPSLPGAKHTYEKPEWEFDQYAVTDTWRFGDIDNPRIYHLRTEPLFQSVVRDPIVTPEDLRIGIEVEYERPVLIDDVNTTSTEGAALYQPWEPTDQDILDVCSLDDPNTGVSVTVQHYVRWSMMGGTPTSVQFEQTRIEGLTTEPIALTGYFSQSFGGGSHLCPKDFLFEPALEPGISQVILDELKDKNVKYIYYTTGARECRPTEWQDTPPQIILYGFDADF